LTDLLVRQTDGRTELPSLIGYVL